MQEAQVKARNDLLAEHTINVKIRSDTSVHDNSRILLIEKYNVPVVPNTSEYANIVTNEYNTIFTFSDFSKEQVLNSEVYFDFYSLVDYGNSAISQFVDHEYVWKEFPVTGSDSIFRLYIYLSQEWDSRDTPIKVNIYLYFNSNTGYLKR
jgi:hypothetical protein